MCVSPSFMGRAVKRNLFRRWRKWDKKRIQKVVNNRGYFPPPNPTKTPTPVYCPPHKNNTTVGITKTVLQTLFQESTPVHVTLGIIWGSMSVV